MTVPAPEPLDQGELATVDRWRRWMRVGLVAALVGFAAWVAWLVAGEPPELTIALPVAGTAVVAFALVVVFGGRCPRCGARLRARSRLRVPERCHRCGVALRA